MSLHGPNTSSEERDPPSNVIWMIAAFFGLASAFGSCMELQGKKAELRVATEKLESATAERRECGKLLDRCIDIAGDRLDTVIEILRAP